MRIEMHSSGGAERRVDRRRNAGAGAARHTSRPTPAPTTSSNGDRDVYELDQRVRPGDRVIEEALTLNDSPFAGVNSESEIASGHSPGYAWNFWSILGQQKKGALPGYCWRAPTYVTELVGYLYRRTAGDLVRVSDRIISEPVTDSPVRLLLVVLLIAINGFFAGAEVSLLSVRHSRLRQMAEEGHAGAQAALNLLSNPGRLLSVTQVGVTLASLGLGWAGEDTIYRHSLRPVPPARTRRSPQDSCTALSFVLSFLVISYFHVVLGEVVPKNLAIAKADRLAALTAPAAAGLLPRHAALRGRHRTLRRRPSRARCT